MARNSQKGGVKCLSWWLLCISAALNTQENKRKNRRGMKGIRLNFWCILIIVYAQLRHSQCKWSTKYIQTQKTDMMYLKGDAHASTDSNVITFHKIVDAHRRQGGSRPEKCENKKIRIFFWTKENGTKCVKYYRKSNNYLYLRFIKFS